jgi:hypothetical protein
MELEWRVFYGDGSTFDNLQGSPFDAPRLDVQVIVQKNDTVGWKILNGHDYFYFDPKRDGWQETNEWHDTLLATYHPLLLFGRRMSRADWSRMRRRAIEEATSAWGPKSGWLESEWQGDDN